jgi:hypothetical protein
MINEDLDPLFTDFAINATIAGQVYPAIFDEFHDDLTLNASGRSLVLTVKTSDAVSFDRSSSVSFNNRTFEIVNIRPVGDGKITEIDLKEL